MLDLDAIVSRYSGEALLQRLLFIASKPTTSEPGRVHVHVGGGNNNNNNNHHGNHNPYSTQAYQLAEKVMKQNGNTVRYRDVFGPKAAPGGSLANNGPGSPGGMSTGGESTASYGGHTSQNSAPGPGGIVYDGHWVSQQEQYNRTNRDVLVGRLNAAQSCLHKDSIRQAYVALSEHDARCGQLTDAIHAVIRAKDCCTTRQQTAIVSLRILELSLYLSNYASVRDYVLKLNQTIGTGIGSASSSAASAAATAAGGDSSSSSSFEDIQVKVKICNALDALYRNEYERSAQLFVQVVTSSSTSSSSGSSGSGSGAGGGSGGGSEYGAGAAAAGAGGGGTSGSTPTPGGGWSSVLANEEIALYTGLLALAFCSRQEMMTLAQHPEALEFVPSLREALTLFARANYKDAYNILIQNGIFEQLRYDIYMSNHLYDLQQRIRSKVLIHAWQPYNRISFQTLQEELGAGLVPSTELLQNEYTKLIGENALGDQGTTRIDLSKQRLVREIPDPELARLQRTRTKLCTTTRNMLDDTYGMIVRLACLEHDLIVGDSGSSGAGAGGSSGAGGGGGGGGGYGVGRATFGGGGGGTGRRTKRRAAAGRAGKMAGFGMGGGGGPMMVIGNAGAGAGAGAGVALEGGHVIEDFGGAGAGVGGAAEGYQGGGMVIDDDWGTGAGAGGGGPQEGGINDDDDEDDDDDGVDDDEDEDGIDEVEFVADDDEELHGHDVMDDDDEDDNNDEPMMMIDQHQQQQQQSGDMNPEDMY